MAREFIITMTAANRVGILSAVTKAMADLGGDLREASQTVVRGFFTMIFSAEFPDQTSPHVITDHLQDVGRPFAPAGKVFKEWVSIPCRDRRRWRALLREGVEFVAPR